MEYRNSALQELKSFFSRRSSLASLIWVNAAVFLFINLANLVFWLFGASIKTEDVDISIIASYLAVPASLPALIEKPWTIFTYMFLQEDFLHLLFNMMVLFFGGQLLVIFLDAKKLVLTYILSGLWGGLFFILAFNTFPVFARSLPYALALGASASVLGILVAAATWSPNYTVQLFLFGKVKLKHIALVLIVLDLISIQKENPGGHIAHLGGAFWGFCYVLMLKKFPGSHRFGTFSLSRILRYPFRKRKSSFRVYPGDGRPKTDEEFNSLRAEKQKTIDLILDKISKNGYEALSRAEKDLLFKSTNNQKEE